MVSRWFALPALLAGFALPVQAQPLAQPGPAADIAPPPPLILAPPPPLPNAAPPPADLRPFQPPPGWFVGMEAFLVRPNVSSTDLWGGSDPPLPNLDLTVSPALTLGYRFEDGNAFLATYRFLGSGVSSSCMGPTNERLNAHWLDLDYRGDLHGPWLWFTFQWQTGIRLSVVDFHIGADSPYLGSQTEDDNFFGAGPHFGIDLNWYAGLTGVGVFTRADVGFLVGQGYQNTAFVQQPYYGSGNLIFTPYSGASSATGIKGQFNVLAAAGLSYTPPTQRWLRFEGGVQLLDFIELGNNFANAGPFVRCEIGF